MNRAINSSAPKQCGIGRIDDRIDTLLGDVSHNHGNSAIQKRVLSV
jgi:hypothetical protein